MVKLLIRHGTQTYEDYCDQGFNATWNRHCLNKNALIFKSLNNIK